MGQNVVVTPAQPRRVGAGAPSPGLGNNGDTYLDRASGREYEKAGGAWGLIFQPTLPTSKLTGTIPVASITGIPNISQGLMSAGPPASPGVFDRWYAVNPFGIGSIVWEFVYLGGGIWKFVGGGDAMITPANFDPGVTSVYTQETGASNVFTMERAGSYMFHLSGYLDNTSTSNNNASIVSFGVNGAQAGEAVIVAGINSASYTGWASYSLDYPFGLAAGNTVGPSVNGGGRRAILINQVFTCTPWYIT